MKKSIGNLLLKQKFLISKDVFTKYLFMNSFRSFAVMKDTKKFLDIKAVKCTTSNKITTIIDPTSSKPTEIEIKDPVEDCFANLSTCKVKVIAMMLNLSTCKNKQGTKVTFGSLESIEIRTTGEFDYAAMYGKSTEPMKFTNSKVYITFKIKDEFKDCRNEIVDRINLGSERCPVYNIFKNSGSKFEVVLKEL